MGIGEERLREALQTSFGSKADVIEQMPAMLGAYINGQKTFVVNGQPDFVWVRVRGQTSDRVKAFNQHAGGVALHWDLPIIIARIPNAPDIWTVIGRDIRRYENWSPSANLPQSSPYLPSHGSDHSFSSQVGMGADPVWVFKRQMMPLLPHPAPTGTMSIDIGSDFYYYNGQYNWFASTGTSAFTSFLPTGAMNGRFVTVYIEGSSGNPAYLAGPEINAVTPPIDAGDYISVPTPAQGVPVAAVFLLTGTSRIGWGEIFDLRHPHVPVPGTGSLHGVYDESVLQGEVGTWNFEGDNIAAVVTGSTAHITHTPNTFSVETGTFRTEELIYDATLASITGSFVVASIPQTYDDLKVVLTARIRESNGAGVGFEPVEFIWNGLTGSVHSTYHFAGGSDGGGGAEHSLDNLTNSPIVGRIGERQGQATGTFDVIDMDVRDYTITGTMIGHDWQGSYHRLNMGVEEPFAQHGTQWFRHYQAINQLQIRPVNATGEYNFEISSRLKVFGITNERVLVTAVNNTT